MALQRLHLQQYIATSLAVNSLGLWGGIILIFSADFLFPFGGTQQKTL